MLDRLRHAPGRSLRLLVAVAATAALCVVSSGSAATAPATLSLLASTTQQAAMTVIIANFERVYPNIKIQAQYLPSNNIEILLLTQFQAGNAPDIFRIGAGNRTAGSWPLAKAGKLLDLSGAKWNERLYKPMARYYKWQGKVIGWPDSVQTFGTVYNVDMFKQLGLSIPTTFAQVLTLCQKINAAGKVPFAQGWQESSTANVWIPQRAAQYVYNTRPTWNTDRAKGKTTFAASKEWQQALQSIQTMKENNCFQPGAQGSTRPQAYGMFSSGQAAMIQIAGGELPNVLRGNTSLHYAMFNLPGENPKTSTVYAPAPTGFAVNASTQHPNEAKTFMAFMAREKQSQLYSKVGGGIAPLDVHKNIIPGWLSPLKPLFKAGRYDGAYHSGWPNSRVFDEALAPCVLGLITGQTNVNTCLTNADNAWNSGP